MLRLLIRSRAVLLAMAIAVGSSCVALAAENLHSVQVNDSRLDHVVYISGQPPIEESSQASSYIASSGGRTVVTYSTTVGLHYDSAGKLISRDSAGYSVSTDEGWQSGLVPAPTGIQAIVGGVVAADRRGNFFTISPTQSVVGRQNDGLAFSSMPRGSSTFEPARLLSGAVAVEAIALAAGRDPINKRRDNIYAAVSTYAPGNGQLKFARSTDGGNTFTPLTDVFSDATATPFDNSAATPGTPALAVDPASGRLYLALLDLGLNNPDFIRLMVSDDGGVTFNFLRLNVPSNVGDLSPDAYAVPTLAIGSIADCGSGRGGGGINFVLHQGSVLPSGRFGYPRWVQSTRPPRGPAISAKDGVVTLAFNTHPNDDAGFVDADLARSEIQILSSIDAGATWAGPTIVVPVTNAQPQNYAPAVVIGEEGALSMAYLVQTADSHFQAVTRTGRLVGNMVTLGGSQRPLGPKFDLPPSDIPPASGNVFTNYDRAARPCTGPANMLTGTSSDNGAIYTWADGRNMWTPPPASLFPHTHPQGDIFVSRAGEEE